MDSAFLSSPESDFVFCAERSTRRVNRQATQGEPQNSDRRAHLSASRWGSLCASTPPNTKSQEPLPESWETGPDQAIRISSNNNSVSFLVGGRGRNLHQLQAPLKTHPAEEEPRNPTTGATDDIITKQINGMGKQEFSGEQDESLYLELGFFQGAGHHDRHGRAKLPAQACQDLV